MGSNCQVDENILSPGTRIKPTISIEEIPALIKTYYGVSASNVKELNAYDDRNFYVEGDDKKYIFKVLNSMDSKKTDKTEAEIGAMKYLASRGVQCPTPVQGCDGSDYYTVNIPNTVPIGDSEGSSSVHVIRLLNYVPGKIMHQVLPTTSLLQKVGSKISEIEIALKEFSHVGFMKHSSIWMMAHVPDLLNFVYVIKDNSVRHKAVMEIIKSFQENVVPHYPQLEEGIIHGDFNEQNILLEENEKNGNEYDVCGVIDFGDMHFSFLVFELGITMCYMMLECLKTEDIDPFVGSAHVLAGYNKHRKVPLTEIRILRTLIASRLCQSLVMGAYTYSLDPGNEYLLTTAKSGWDLLLRLWNETNEDELQNIWNSHLN